MMSFFKSEESLRLLVFFSVFVVMACWELIAARRKLHASKARRWLNNGLIIVIDTLCVKLIFPISAVGMALLVESQEWGLFQVLQLSAVFKIIVSIIAMDVIIYGQHVMFHAVPFFWRFHKMHHVDLDLDVTSGLRFHPVEIVLSMGIKFLAIFLLGVPALGVLIFEVLLNATSLFNHANVTIPLRVDGFLRNFLVTPDMHRIHHSTLVAETNSNFGFNLSWWDKLFNTYRALPQKGHEAMEIGLPEYRKPQKCIYLFAMLMLPFK